MRTPRRTGIVLGACVSLALAAVPSASASHSGPPELAPAPSGETGMPLVGNSDKDGTINTDLAFWGSTAFAGNYNGFRVLDISDPSRPTVLSDYFCRGPQNDVSVFQLRGRLLLFQSVDVAQTKADCDGTAAGSSQDTPVSSTGQRLFGFEGVRVYDVTDPSAPVFLTAVATACGSHTHTLVPDLRHQRVLLYVSSYPLGSGITPAADLAAAGPLACQAPHQKISIVEVTAAAPERARLLREEPLSSDSRPYPGAGGPSSPPFIACHDVQVFLATNTALGACGGDAQVWDISDPADPTASDGERHTHIARPAVGGASSPEAGADDWEFVNSAVATWDGRYMAFSDETGGGATGECDGSAEEAGGQSENGFYYFYEMVRPGEPAPPLLSRYMIPRPQGTEPCVMRYGNVVPTSRGYYLVTAAYQGGDSVVDFTDPAHPVEVAFADRHDDIGSADSWSTYWYNDHVYSSTGLTREGLAGNRGLDVARVVLPDGSALRARSFHHMNPQTQESSQTTGAGRR